MSECPEKAARGLHVVLFAQSLGSVGPARGPNLLTRREKEEREMRGGKRAGPGTRIAFHFLVCALPLHRWSLCERLKGKIQTPKIKV